jgi:hypothetical protein
MTAKRPIVDVTDGAPKTNSPPGTQAAEPSELSIAQGSSNEN